MLFQDGAVEDWLLHIGGATAAVYVASMNLLRRPFLLFSTDEVCDAQCEVGNAILHSGSNVNDYTIAVHGAFYILS